MLTRFKKIILFLVVLSLLTLVLLSLIPIFNSLFLVSSGSLIFTKVTVYLFFLKLTGTLALILIGITMITGALRSLLIAFYNSPYFWKLHTKWTSSMGIGFGVAHLIIFILYEQRLGIFQIPHLLPSKEDLLSRNNLIFYALTALVVVTINTIIAHIPGIVAKKWWRPVHIINYIALILVLTHAFFIGSDSSKITFRILYLFLGVATTLGVLFRISMVFIRKHPTTPTPIKNVVIPPEAPSQNQPETLITSKFPDSLPQINQTQNSQFPTNDKIESEIK